MALQNLRLPVEMAAILAKSYTLMERPKIRLELSAADKLLEALGYLAVAALWTLAIANYAALPTTIPIHYNGAGIPDGFGDKSTILTLPLVATILFASLTALNNFPHVFNYLTEITNENAAAQYTNATKLIRCLKLGIVLIFGAIAYQTIQTAGKKAAGLGGWFLPVSMGLIFIPLLLFIVKSISAKE